MITDYCRLLLIRPDDDSPVTFSCSGTKGALISLPITAQREDTVAQGDFGKWIVSNIDECMRLAEDLGWGVNRMEDIILVTGRHLAKSWVNVTFSESRGGAQVSFGVRVSGDSCVHLEERNMTGGELKLGPSGEVGFCVQFTVQVMLRNQVLYSDTARIYPRTNAYSFEGTVSSAS